MFSLTFRYIVCRLERDCNEVHEGFIRIAHSISVIIHYSDETALKMP